MICPPNSQKYADRIFTRFRGIIQKKIIFAPERRNMYKAAQLLRPLMPILAAAYGTADSLSGRTEQCEFWDSACGKAKWTVF